MKTRIQPTMQQYLRSILALWAVLVCFSAAWARLETSTNMRTGEDFKNLFGMMVRDNRYFDMGPSNNWSAQWGHRSSIAYLDLSVNEFSHFYHATPITLTVTFNVAVRDANHVLIHSLTGETLTCEYDPTNEGTGSRYDHEILTFENAHYINVRITSITSPQFANVRSQIDTWNDSPFQLRARIETERIYRFNPFVLPNPSHTHVPLTGDNRENGDLRISWPSITGAEEYDVEYTHINNYRTASTFWTAAETDCSEKLFDHNATRVRVKAGARMPAIPLVFDRGFLIYRVRAIGRNHTNPGSDAAMTGRWSTYGASCGHVDCYDHYTITTPHEGDLNWQHLANFAENGLRSDVVTYMDGSLRARQTVTRDRSKGRSIFTETFYDHAGRGVIQTLPAPFDRTSIGLGYMPHFTVDAGDDVFDREDFDLDVSECAVAAPTMGDTRGAGEYYTSNTDPVHYQNNVPSAGGYPYTQTEYIADRTGRVSRQSGPGQDHILGSGHETRYFYDQPTQYHLDRLFGTEAGYASHYQRQYTIDANGQVSVTYSDMHGRTIATALAGSAPAGLEDILATTYDGEGQENGTTSAPQAAILETVETDLLNKAQVNDPDTPLDNNVRIDAPAGEGLLYSAPWTSIISTPGDVEVEYKAYIGSFDPPCTEHVYPFVYDLQVSMTDLCGSTVMTGVNTQFGTPVLGGTAPVTHSDSWSWQPTVAPLEQYTIRKWLGVDQDVLDQYVEHYMQQIQESGCVSLGDFIEAAEGEMPPLDNCDITCAECEEQLPGELTPLGEYTPELSQLLEDCNAACQTPTLCESFHQAMLLDVVPGGQYAAMSGQEHWGLSILNPSNVLPQLGGEVRSYRRTDIIYLDELGEVVRVQLDPLNSGFSPGVVNSGLVTDENGGTWEAGEVPFTVPNNLNDPMDFVMVFRSEWAAQLVVLHPEYCYYDFCTQLADEHTFGYPSPFPGGSIDVSSDEFDQAMLETSTLAAAISSPVGNLTRPESSDPFFWASASPGYDWRQWMFNNSTGLFWNYAESAGAQLTMRQAAAVMESAGNWFGNDLPIPTDNLGTIALTTDAHWLAFRSMYQAAKRDAHERAANRLAHQSATDCNCDCIGNPGYNPYTQLQQAFSGTGPGGWADAIDAWLASNTQPDKVCALQRIDLLGQMERRFMVNRPKPICDPPGYVQAMTDEANANLCALTGQCPTELRMQTFLNGLLQNGVLTTSNTLLQDQPGFSIEMYTALTGLDPQTNPYSPYEWDAPFSGNTLYGNINNISNAWDLSVTLVLESGSGLIWPNFGTAFTIDRFEDLLGSNRTNCKEFVMQAWVDTDPLDEANALTPVRIAGLISSGHSDLCFAPCEPVAVPHATPLAADLVLLINQLIQDGNNFDQSSFPMTASEYEWFPSPATGDDWEWMMDTPDEEYILSTSGTESYTITFPSNSLDLSDFVLERIEPSGISSPNAISYWIDPTTETCIPVSTHVKYYYDEDGIAGNDYEGFQPIGSYGPPLQPQCETPGALAAENLLAFLNAQANYPGLTSNTDLLSVPHFNYLIAIHPEWIEATAATWSLMSSGPSAFTQELFLERPSVSPRQWKCNFDFTFADPLNCATCDLEDISGFTSIAPGPASIEQDGTTAVLLYATIGSESVPVLLTSCMHVEPCTPCELCNAVPLTVSCFDTFDALQEDYSDEMEWTQDEICELGLAPCLYEYMRYREDLGIDPLPEDHWAYISAQDFCIQGLQYHWEAYLAYLDIIAPGGSITAINPAWPHLLSLSEFAGLQVSQACLDAYGNDIEVNCGNCAASSSIPPHLTPLTCDQFGPLVLCYPPPDHIDDHIVAPDPCITYQTNVADNNASEAYEDYLELMEASFREQYIQQALATPDERLWLRSNDQEYHYTLYYYDQGGDLVRTVPPQGVRRNTDATFLNDVRDARNAGLHLPAEHQLVTTYAFNSLHQLRRQYVPDHTGVSIFGYDELGRLVWSQNARQAALSPDRYSYTLYDALGRIKEAGELESATPITASTLTTGFNTAYPTRYEVVRTYYDQVALAGPNNYYNTTLQNNLRMRVAHAARYEVYSLDDLDYDHATHYDYDIHGNVRTLVQEFNDPGLHAMEQGFKRMDYRYDLISGNVLEVGYQLGQKDQFLHRYTYDAQNRLTHVKTSSNKVYWDTDASYAYYAHGPLARTQLGQLKVQGTDMAYTIQGWLKANNSDTPLPLHDMGQDGHAVSGNARRWVARDAFGYSLGYYDGDYYPVNIPLAYIAQVADPTANAGLSGTNLYNGNIRYMALSTPDLATELNSAYGVSTFSSNMAFGFRYDQLHRLARSIHVPALSSSTMSTPNDWASSTNGAFTEDLTYDQNGNIRTLVRRDESDVMDDLLYAYVPGTNQLDHVDDAQTTAYTVDLEDQAAANYTYDPIGELIDDAQAGHSLTWNASGKLKEVHTSAPGGTNLRMHYDAAGQRVIKELRVNDYLGDLAPQHSWSYIYQVRDVQGNIMATYKRRYEYSAGIYRDRFEAQEIDLYGSSRLGRLKNYWNSQTSASFTSTGFDPVTQEFEGVEYGAVYSNPLPQLDNTHWYIVRGYKKYELTDHLGNVRALVTDDRNSVASSSTLNHFTPSFASGSDFYPFGSLMPGRDLFSSTYPFGFQGQEKDDEIHGWTGTSYNYEHRMHDPRVGRMLSIDPLAAKYPFFSPYAFSGNRVIDKVELEGLEPADPPYTWTHHGNDREGYYGNPNGNLMRVSDAGSVQRYWVYQTANQNGTTSWQWYDESEKTWKNDWIPNGYVQASADGAPMLDANPYVKPGPCYGCAFDDFMQKALLGGSMAATGFLAGGALGYGATKLFDAGNETAQEYIVNRGNWGLVDWGDVTGAAMPTLLGQPFGAAVDYNAAEGFRSVFTGDKLLGSAAVELGFGFGVKLFNVRFMSGVPMDGLEQQAGKAVMELATGAAGKEAANGTKARLGTDPK